MPSLLRGLSVNLARQASKPLSVAQGCEHQVQWEHCVLGAWWKHSLTKIEGGKRLELSLQDEKKLNEEWEK